MVCYFHGIEILSSNKVYFKHQYYINYMLQNEIFNSKTVVKYMYIIFFILDSKTKRVRANTNSF